MSNTISVRYERAETTRAEFQFLWQRPPLCKCGTVMRWMERDDRFFCTNCGATAGKVACGANLASLSTHDLHRCKVTGGVFSV